MSLGRTVEMSTQMPAQDIPGLLAAVARGPHHAGDLNPEAARLLFAEWLSGQLSPIAQGALWTAFRFKGESIGELLGFVRATEEALVPVPLPAGPRPVVFASYNGGRRHVNLLPLLALLLARAGVPVLIHGAYGGIADEGGLALARHDPSVRVSTGEILAALGFAPAPNRYTLQEQLADHRLAYVALDTLHPRLAAILSLRRQLGVRSSAHTIVKLFNPFAETAILCAAVTHPPYLEKMQGFFRAARAHALVLRGCEGEPVAHPRRRPALTGIVDGHLRPWFAEDRAPLTEIPALPSDSSVGHTCLFIEEVLAGHRPIPAPICDQGACLLVMSGVASDLPDAYKRIGRSGPLSGDPYEHHD